MWSPLILYFVPSWHEEYIFLHLQYSTICPYRQYVICKKMERYCKTLYLPISSCLPASVTKGNFIQIRFNKIIIISGFKKIFGRVGATAECICLGVHQKFIPVLAFWRDLHGTGVAHALIFVFVTGIIRPAISTINRCLTCFIIIQTEWNLPDMIIIL